MTIEQHTSLTVNALLEKTDYFLAKDFINQFLEKERVSKCLHA